MKYLKKITKVSLLLIICVIFLVIFINGVYSSAVIRDSEYDIYLQVAGGGGAKFNDTIYSLDEALSDLSGVYFNDSDFEIYSGYVPTTFEAISLCGNAIINSGEECDGSNLNNQTCVTKGYVSGTLSCSASCSFDVSGCSSGGGSSGGGGGGAPSAKIDVSIEPTSLDLLVLSGKQSIKELKIKNLEKTFVSFTIKLEGEIKDYIKMQDSFNLSSNEEKTLILKVENVNKGLLAGKIILKSGSYVKEVLVVINAKSENFLFDSSITIPDEFKIISSGDKLSAQVNLLEIGLKEKVDVTATYVIKDFSGKKYLEESETFFVFGSKEYVKEFSMKGIPPGKYIIGLDIVYPNAFATSSAQFEISEKGFGGISTKGIILILIAGIVAIGFIIWALRGKRLIYKKFKERVHYHKV